MRRGAAAADLILVIAILVELSDAADGRIARRWNIDSLAGGILDSGSDQIARATEFVGLVYLGVVPLAVVLLFVCRDAIVMSLRQLVDARGLGGRLRTRSSGKVKGVAQGACIIALCGYLTAHGAGASSFSDTPVWAQCSVWLAAGVTCASLLDYLAASYPLLLSGQR